MNVITVWLIIGVFLVALEALGLSGIGLLFAGIGSVMAGLAVHLNWVPADNAVGQFLVFCVATAMSGALLYKPLKKLRDGKPAYHNMIGEVAFVGSNGLSKRGGGEVTWSGTIMKAKLIPDASVDQLEAGTEVVIVQITGATLLVKPHL